MRGRLVPIAVAVIAGLALTAFAMTRIGGEDDAPPAAFPKWTTSAGEIDIELQPHHVDGTGAEVKVVLDTHSVELGMDLVTGATLEVGGVAWPTVAWDGDGPSGHHREGRLRFDVGGSADGPIELRLVGFADPIVATWDAGS